MNCAVGTEQRHLGESMLFCCYFSRKDDVLAISVIARFPLCPCFPGHGPCQHALPAPHGGLRGLLHRSAHPFTRLRCLLEVRTLVLRLYLFPPQCAKTTMRPNEEEMFQARLIIFFFLAGGSILDGW